MEVRFFEVNVSLHSPTVITKRRTATGFLGTLDHIPASTLRGAIISALYRNEAITKELLTEESKRPRIIASPAYPLVNGRQSFPAHPFIYDCKKCGVKDQKHSLWSTVEDAVKDIIDGKDPVLPYECKERHRAVTSLHPKPVLMDGDLEKVTQHHFRVVCVGISRTRASSVKGMLYSYEALTEGLKFWATIVVPANLDINKAKELFIGRGKSRGMGRASMSIKAELDPTKEIDSIRNNLRTEWFVMYSTSPMLGIDEHGYSITYPRSIDLRQIASRSGLKCNGYLDILAVYGRITYFNAGWDLLTKKGRPVFEARAPGTVVRARLTGVSADEAALTLATLRYLGTILETSDTIVTGVNMLTPLNEKSKG